MVTKLEAGHKYRDRVLGVFIYLDEDEDGYLIYGPGSMGITGMQRHRLDLSTIVEVCYVDGEEMIVGDKYFAATGSEENVIMYRINTTFVGVIDGKPIFAGKHPYSYIAWPYYVLAFSVSPVPTYHLVKSIDGKEVSRVEVSWDKAKELGE